METNFIGVYYSRFGEISEEQKPLHQRRGFAIKGHVGLRGWVKS